MDKPKKAPKVEVHLDDDDDDDVPVQMPTGIYGRVINFGKSLDELAEEEVEIRQTNINPLAAKKSPEISPSSSPIHGRVHKSNSDVQLHPVNIPSQAYMDNYETVTPAFLEALEKNETATNDAKNDKLSLLQPPNQMDNIYDLIMSPTISIDIPPAPAQQIKQPIQKLEIKQIDDIDIDNEPINKNIAHKNIPEKSELKIKSKSKPNVELKPQIESETDTRKRTIEQKNKTKSEQNLKIFDVATRKCRSLPNTRAETNKVEETTKQNLIPSWLLTSVYDVEKPKESNHLMERVFEVDKKKEFNPLIDSVYDIDKPTETNEKPKKRELELNLSEILTSQLKKSPTSKPINKTTDKQRVKKGQLNKITSEEIPEKVGHKAKPNNEVPKCTGTYGGEAVRNILTKQNKSAEVENDLVDTAKVKRVQRIEASAKRSKYKQSKKG